MTNQERLQANNEAIENIQQTLASKMVAPAADYATIEDVENAVKDKATIDYVDTKVADLVNSAPETLDTLGEVATALQNNSNVVDALNSAIGNKVDKVSGKGLSTNDYTTAEKEKLSGLSNYDDTAIKSQINSKASIADMTAYINEHKDELKGDKGDDGSDYVLTDTDKTEIANKTKELIPLDNYTTIEEVEEIAINALGTETLPSPNIVNINDTESWPFGISETEVVKGLYSWVDSDGYAHIKGTTTEGCTIMFLFDTEYTTFEAGTYCIGFDDVLRTGSQSVTIKFGDSSTAVQLNDKTPKATVTLAESASLNKVDVVFTKDCVVDFKGHCWITKDEPIDFFVPKGGSYKVPITPAKKEDFEEFSKQLDDYNVIGIFDSIGGVGDSLMSGYINTTDTNIGADTVNYSKSWLTQLKKITGVDITHYSYSGATTKNWLQNQNQCYDNIVTSPCDAYYIALGTNDSSNWANISLGSVTDMGTDTETFYGMYAKVIARVREANPRAPIFMLSMYWTGFPTFNEAIEEMANVTENAYYIDITDMNDKYSQYRQGYHFNAMGYYYIAQNIIKRTADVIIKNHTDFNNLGITS